MSVYAGESLEDFERRRIAKLPADTHTRQLINEAKRRLIKAVPKDWRGVLDGMAAGDSSVWWRKDDDALECLTAFEKEQGAAAGWNLSDDEICIRAVRCADEATELVAMAGESDVDKLDSVLLLCRLVGVDAPEALTVAGAVARGCSDVWWRRRIRKKVARVVEHGAIKLGLVNRARGGYASDGAVRRRGDQIARNEAMLKKTLIRNEAGQVYSLHELAALSVANRSNRKDELMTRIRGCEEYADSVGHVGMFFTLTCPSKFHAVTFNRRGGQVVNRKYNGADPREAQAWHRRMWAQARAELARQGVQIYGFRVAEPHHDATPHWHALFWCRDAKEAAMANAIIRSYWLSEDGDELGASKHRVKLEYIDRAKGSATSYIAKYISKNIGGGYELPALDGLEVETKGIAGYKRVDAWAATWGIRQFQSIGLPSVTVWRCLRGVDKEQAEQARTGGDVAAWKAYGAVHKSGELKACFMRFIGAMGGVCVGRDAWALQVAKRVNRSVNGFGESFEKKVAVGVVMQSGGWLVSKKIAWRRVVDESAPESVEGKSDRARLAAPWTRFNNCTARLTGDTRRLLFGSPRLLYDSFEVYRTG